MSPSFVWFQFVMSRICVTNQIISYSIVIDSDRFRWLHYFHLILLVVKKQVIGTIQIIIFMKIHIHFDRKLFGQVIFGAVFK